MNKKEMSCYTTDASMLFGEVKKVVFPKNVEELKKIIKTSNSDIVPRGAGSNLTGGTVPNKSIIIDMGKMNKVLAFNPSKKTVLVEAGITIKELNERLSSRGFEFPIVPSNKGISTIGGMIATNASGSKTMKYGKMKEWIEEVTFVSGRGEVMKTSKADLGDVCGMEGITGVIVSANLRIIRKIKGSASIFQTDEIEEVLSIARRLKLENEVNMLQLLPPELSKLIGLPGKYHIIIGFDSDRGKIKGSEYEIVSSFKDRIYPLLYSRDYCESLDPKLFYDKLREFISLLEANQIPYFGYLGQGIIFPFFRKEDSAKKREIIKFIQKVRGKPGVYGIGLERKYFLDGFEKKVLQRVKLRHDPFCKLNRGKVIDVDPDSRLFMPSEVRKTRHLRPLDKEEIEDIKKLEKSFEPPTRPEPAKPSTSLEPIKPKPPFPIGEIKPTIREEKTTQEISQEISHEILEHLKTPEEKMEDFIEEIKSEEFEDEDDEMEEDEEYEEEEEPEEFEDDEMEEEEEEKVSPEELELGKELNKEIKDYEQTYNSEFSEERRRIIEDFAKNVAKDMYARELDHKILKQPEKKQEVIRGVKTDFERSIGETTVTDNLERRPREKEKIDYDAIRDIMTNKYKPDEEKEDDR